MTLLDVNKGSYLHSLDFKVRRQRGQWPVKDGSSAVLGCKLGLLVMQMDGLFDQQASRESDFYMHVFKASLLSSHSKAGHTCWAAADEPLSHQQGGDTASRQHNSQHQQMTFHRIRNSHGPCCIASTAGSRMPPVLGLKPSRTGSAWHAMDASL